MDTTDKPKFDAKAAQRALYEQQLGGAKPETPPSTDSKSQDSEKSGVDNNQNNGYIKDNDTTNASGGDATGSGDDKVKNLLEQTFHNNTEELGKAYLNSQREYQKLRQTTKQQEEILTYFKNLSEKSPMFEKVLDAIENDKPLETVLQNNNRQEPNQVNQQNINGKSNNVNVFEDIKVDDLVKNGYINKEVYDTSSNIERDAMVQRARMSYLPKLMADQAEAEYRNRLQEIEKKTTLDNKKAELQRRYDNSFDDVVSKYNIDFTKNPEILDEVDKLVPTYLDPSDRTMFRKDAFEKAFLEVAETRNLELKKVQLSRDTVLNSGTQFQSGNSKRPSNLTVEDQFTKAYADKFKSRMDARSGWRK